MTTNEKRFSKTVLYYYICLVTFIAIVFALAILNPLWERYEPPFSMERIFPAILAPVDGPFYLKNADEGYQWRTKNPLSLWFHPLMSFMTRLFPTWFPSKIWYWCISVVFGMGSILLSYRIAEIYRKKDQLPPYLPLFLLLIPGGIGIATGNPEFPTLFFAAALLLSVIVWRLWYVTIICAILAILAKPNALYIIPMLTVYFFVGVYKKEASLWREALLGMLTIPIGWIFWILYVDLNSGELGAYWNARSLFSQYVAGSPIKYFLELVNNFVYRSDFRDQVRYSSALIIPVVNMWVIGTISFSEERHRYALAAGNLGMLALILLTGNPNKVIVYATTIPGYFSVFFLMFYDFCSRKWLNDSVFHPLIALIYLIYCIAMFWFYIYGTPQGWYY